MDKWLDNVNVVRIAALILAILLWAVVHLDRTPAAPFSSNESAKDQRMINDIQITYTGVDASKMHVRSIDPAFANIVIKGETSDINKVSPKDGQSRVTLNLDSLSQGIHDRVPLQAVGFPEGVQVDIYPPNVKVVLEDILQKEVPVQLELQGEPASGYQAGEPIISPARVFVTLPSSELEQVVAVKTSVDIRQANEAVVVSRKLIAINQRGEEVSDAIINPAVVEIEIPVTSPFKTVPLQVRLTGETPSGFSLSSVKQNMTEITLFAPEHVLDKYDFYDGPVVDLSSYSSSQSLSLKIPINEGIYQVSSESVVLQLDIVASGKKTLQGVPLILNGQSEGAKTTLVSPESGLVDIVVEGAPSLLSLLSNNDVQAIVDVSNLPPGTHEIDVKLNLPRFMKNGGAAPLRVTVTIAPAVEATAPPAGETSPPEVGEVPPPEGQTDEENPQTDADPSDDDDQSVVNPEEEPTEVGETGEQQGGSNPEATSPEQSPDTDDRDDERIEQTDEAA